MTTGTSVRLSPPSSVASLTATPRWSGCKGTDVPVVMDGYADWCGPCKIMAPILDDFARQRQGDVLVLKLDTDRNPATTLRFNIRAIPTLIVFRDGREVARRAGVIPRPELDALVGPIGPAGPS